MDFNEIKTGLNEEIQWGLNYREDTKNAKKISLSPKSSPINLHLMWEKYQITRKIQELEMIKKQFLAKPPPKNLHLTTRNKVNRVDRSAFTRKQYINFLSTPHPRYVAPRKKRNPLLALRRKLRRKQKCTARLTELAKPTRTRVYHTWKDHWCQLPAEILERLNELLQTDHTLDPSFARCCFKDLDRKRKKRKYKRLRRRRMISKRKQQEDNRWLKTQVDVTVDLIIEFLQNETLLGVNYKQMLLSNVMINRLVAYGHFKRKPMRNSNKPYQRAVIEIVDQLAVWMDTIVRYIDVQSTDSDQIVKPSLESLLRSVEIEEEEEEEEEDYGKPFKGERLETTKREKEDTDTYGTSKTGKKKKKPTEKASATETTITTSQEFIDKGTTDTNKFEDTSQFGEEEVSSVSSKGVRTGGTGVKKGGAIVKTRGEEEGTESYSSVMDKLRKSDEESLAKLIGILSQSSADFLQKHIDELGMPGVTYEDVLNRVKNLQDAQMKEEKEKRKTILEKSMVEWAKSNDPDEVNDKLLHQIHSAADIISECIKKEGGLKDATGTEMSSSSKKGSSATESSKTPTKRPLRMTGEDSETSSKRTPVTPLENRKPGLVDTDQDVSEISSVGSRPKTSETKSWKTSEAESAKTASVKFSDHAEDAEGSFEPGKVTTAKKPAIKKIQKEEEEKGVGVQVDKGLQQDIFGIIPKHKPLKTFEHSPDTICCLTIKVWATWLLEVANNAEKWSNWLNAIVKEIRYIASIIRGEVLDCDGNMVMFYRDDWRAFVEKVEKMVVSWRQYSMHVRDLTDKIINNFHGKRITCCPKCLEDNLIVNIAVAHDISQQLAEAMNTASYWRRWIDSVMMETQRLTSATAGIMDRETMSEISSYGIMELIEIQIPRQMPSQESIYEIEEFEYCRRR